MIVAPLDLGAMRDENGKPNIPAMLHAIGWELSTYQDGTPCAVDRQTGAVRIADRWGPDFEPAGQWTCGSRGPNGRWCTFEDAVVAAYEHHILPSLRARVAELEATLANERGEGEPPSPGWVPEFTKDGCFWSSERLITGLLADGWHWTARRGRKPYGVASTARDAMRQADAALKASS